MALEELRANQLPHLRTFAVTCCPRLRHLQAAGLYRLERYRSSPTPTMRPSCDLSRCLLLMTSPPPIFIGWSSTHLNCASWSSSFRSAQSRTPVMTPATATAMVTAMAMAATVFATSAFAWWCTV